MLGGIRTENGRIDLKKIRPVWHCHDRPRAGDPLSFAERATPARLSAAAALGRGAQDLDALARAQSCFLDLIVAQQVADMQAGLPPSNKVAVKRLARPQRADLRASLSAVRHLDTLTRDLLF